MLEFVSVLRRLVGGDVKVAPTADDKVLIVDSVDLDKIKTARVGDLPQSSPPSSPFWPLPSFFKFDRISGGGLLRLPLGHSVLGHFIVGDSATWTIAPENFIELFVNISNNEMTVLPGVGPGPYEYTELKQRTMETLTGVKMDSYIVPPYSAVLFVSDNDGNAHFVAIPLGA